MNARWMAASDWLQRLDRDEAPEEEFQAWVEWCSASPRNDAAYEEMRRLYRALREAPQEYKEALRELAEARQARREFKYMRALAASVLLVVGAAAAWWLWRAASPQIYATSRGEHRTVTLSDRSQLVLGGGSSVEVRYGKEERLLTLREGEAWFRVWHDAARPFVVQAGSVWVTAVGTAFDVQRGTERVAVAVTEGRVQLDSGARQWSLSQGERAVIAVSAAAPKAPPQVTHVDPAAVTAWQEGQLQFVDEPLSVVIESVNRYAHKEVVVGEAGVGQMTYTGTVQRARADEWIENLPQVFPVREVTLRDGSVVLVGRKE